MRICIVVFIFMLSGCSDSITKMDFPAASPDLADCSFYELTNKHGAHIIIARCPNSATSVSYRSGKVQKTVIMVDGVEYERKE